MKKSKIAILMMMVIMMLFPSQAMAGEPADWSGMMQQTAAGMKTMVNTEKDTVLSETELLPAGNSVSDWTAVSLALAGSEDDYATYLDELESYVTDCYKTQGFIDDVKATETQRIALTVLALGGDPTAFGKDADGNPVNLVADGTWNFSGESVGMQGTNGYIYALLVLDAKDYQIPDSEVMTRESLIASILSAQNKDGGISMASSGDGSIDITAMALQALAPYQGKAEVDKAIDKALTWIGNQISTYGTFEAFGTESCESSAQVLMAMAALNIDPMEDTRLINNNMTIADGMEQFRLDDGTYMHTPADGKGDLMATQQALLGLEAMETSQAGEGWIFDFTNYEGPNQQASGMPTVFIIIGVLAVALVCGGVVLMKKKK